MTKSFIQSASKRIYPTKISITEIKKSTKKTRIIEKVLNNTITPTIIRSLVSTSSGGTNEEIVRGPVRFFLRSFGYFTIYLLCFSGFNTF